MAMTGAMLMAADARWGDAAIACAGGEGGLSGGVDPPGGITDEPPEVANTDGAWTATVGGTEFAGLTEDDVGTVLWRGSRVPVEIAGEGDSVELSEQCEPFPDVELSGQASGGASIETRISVDIDPFNCAILVGEVYRSVSELSTDEFGPTSWTNGWASTLRKAYSRPIALNPWLRDSQPRMSQPTWPDDTRYSDASSRMSARDLPFGLGFLLTEAQVRHRYEIATVTPLGATGHCFQFSPGRLLGVRWVEDDCETSQTDLPGSWVYSRQTGRFHGEAQLEGLGIGTLVGNTQHTHRVTLRGYEHNEYYSCLVSPSSIRNVMVRLLERFTSDEGIEYRARFECDYFTDVR